MFFFLLNENKKGKQPLCICVIEESQNGSYTEKETIHFIRGVEEKEILSKLYKSELVAICPLNVSSLTSVLLTLKW